MPITYNEAKNIWELTDPTEGEKESLMNIAIEEITHFFGEEIAQKIVHKAAMAGREVEVEAEEENVKPTVN